jgi:uncharacterized protein YsxB (DUF464 family)
MIQRKLSLLPLLKEPKPNMITITIKPKGFHVKGHANYGEAGNDIVCSAISTLAQTAIVAVGDFQYIETVVEKGNLSLKIPGKATTLVADVILNAIYKGFREVARAFPDNVQIKEE